MKRLPPVFSQEIAAADRVINRSTEILPSNKKPKPALGVRESASTHASQPRRQIPLPERETRGTPAVATTPWASPGSNTTTSGGRTVVSPLTEVVSLIGDKRPDLIDFLVTLERTTRDRAQAAVEAETAALHARVTETMARVAEFADKEVASSGQLNDLIANTQRQVEGLVRSVDLDRKNILEDAKAANENLKRLHDELVAERDGLATDLKNERASAAAAAKSYAGALAVLDERNERDRRDADERAEADAQRIRELEARVADLKAKVRATLESRDRIAQRVREVESKLEGVVLPLREDLERARSRGEKLHADLREARKQIAALKLLAKTPT